MTNKIELSSIQLGALIKMLGPQSPASRKRDYNLTEIEAKSLSDLFLVLHGMQKRFYLGRVAYEEWRSTNDPIWWELTEGDQQRWADAAMAVQRSEEE